MNIEYSTLTELFEGIVQKYPHRIALKDCDTSLTYLQLYQYSCRLSEMLTARTILAGDRIVCVSRKNVESIICFWGILMCGGIPVMLDHEDGAGPNALKIDAVAPKAVVLDKRRAGITIEAGACLVFDFADLLTIDDPLTYYKYIYPIPAVNVCYILLTSGTTGNPKAVQISHQNVLHYTYSIYEKIGSPERVNALHASTFAADLGLTNLLVALISGGMLRILNKTESSDPALFNEIVDRDKISLLKITPSHFLSLVSNIRNPYDKPIETIILGGEKLSWETIRTIRSLRVCSRLYNHYGPTETTIGAIAFSIEESSPHFGVTGSVPLGKPLGEGKCFLDNRKDNTGELCVWGPGVSVGYLNNEADNSKKFFIKEVMGENVYCYRTGDICKELEDGNYEFLYRIDRQVKIKGYRIEPGEIELQIAAHPDVENVNVDVFTINEHNILDAYIKPVKGRGLTAGILRNWLSNYLPGYKMPSNFYFYTETPTNSNGKIDMKALKNRFKNKADHRIAESTNVQTDPWSRLVTDTWRQILNKQEVFSTDNFYETGGDSILAIQLIGRLQRHGYGISLTDLMNNPRLGDFILAVPARISSPKETFPGQTKAMGFLTLSQQEFLQEENLDLDHYSQAILLETTDRINVREMAIAFNYVLQMHTQLTRAFNERDLHQKMGKHDPGPGLGMSLLDDTRPAVVQIQDTVRSLLHTMSLDRARLFVGHIFIDPGRKDYLYIACHHLAVDVISWNIILDEMLDLYEQLLKKKPFALKTENIVDRFYSELSIKKDATAGLPRRIPQEVYRIPVNAQNHHSPDIVESCHFAIPEEIIRELKARDEHGQSSRLPGFLLNALGASILDEFIIPRISIDLEFHGRPRQDDLPDLSNSVAWWAVTLPLHLKKEDLQPSVCAGLIEKEALIANKLNLQTHRHKAERAGRPDIRFNYLGYFPLSFENSAIRMVPSYFNPGATRSEKAQREYKFYFTARFLGEVLVIDLQYQVGWFGKDRIRRLVRSFLSTLAFSITSAPAAGWSHESAHFSNLPSVGLPLFNASVIGNERTAAPRTILLTGASGFLGSHLLRELTGYENCRIYCLVRGDDQAHAERRLECSFRHYFDTWPQEARHRIKVIKGDLLSENMGMSSAEYATIAQNADLILHSAADINLTKEYSDLERINVDATRAIIRLAGTGMRKELHYVSTLAVSGYSPGNGYRNFSEKDLDYGQSFISGYERSKFESEKAVRQFLKECGKGRIYRVGHIAADSVYGRFQKNAGQNRIFQIINGIILLKMAPHEYEERLSFSYVDIVAGGIIGSCIGNIRSEMDCMHIENPQYIPFSLIIDMLLKTGYSIEMVPMEKFRQAVAAFDEGQDQKKIVDLMSIWVQRAIDFPRMVNYTHKESLDLMARGGLYFPKITLEWFSNLIEEGIKAGYFQSSSSSKSKIYSYETDY